MEINYVAPPTIGRFMQDNSFVRGLQGPVGSGKSVACVIECLRRMQMQAPSDDGIRRTRIGVVRNTMPELKSTTIKTWLDWLPEDPFGKFYWQPPFTHNVKFDDVQSEVIFFSIDREEDVKKLFSLELTMAWCNEVQFLPKVLVDRLTERVGRYPSKRIGGATWSGIILDTNAPDPDHWFSLMSQQVPLPDDMNEDDRAALSKPANWSFHIQPPAIIEVRDGDGTTRWELNRNAENVENLPSDYYTSRLGGKRRSEILRLYGNKPVVSVSGERVYTDFVEHVHVASEPIRIVEGSPVYIGMDFGLTPAAVIAQEIGGRWLIQRELVSYNMGVDRFGEELRRLLNREYKDIASRKVILWGDPAGDQRVQTDETTPFMLLQGKGFDARPAGTNEFNVRVGTVNSVFRRQSGILIDPSCRNLIRACAGGYHYPTIQGQFGSRLADRPSKSDKNTHIADALQYLLVGGGESVQFLVGDRKQSGMKPSVMKREFSLARRHPGRSRRGHAP